MTVRLIGAGLPRTGTTSLRVALSHLLGGPVHHMSEVLSHPEQASTWASAIQGSPPDWTSFLAGYVAGVDAPFSSCWRDLVEAFPRAPVLLSVRADPATWLRSMQATAIPRTRELQARADDPVAPLFQVLFEDLVDDLDADDAAWEAGYVRWAETVRAGVDPERLVEWRPGDGWPPLCRALEVPVPDRPFPHENSTAAYLARQGSRADRDAERITEQRSDRINAD